MTFFFDRGFAELQFWKKKKNENGPLSWTEWNNVMKFCINIDIDMM